MKEITPVQLINWLTGKSNMIVFVTGPTGAGKSTLIGNLQARLSYTGVYPGRTVRNRPELLELVKKSQNPTAVPELEVYIRKYVTKRVMKTEGGCVAVDGIPRTIEQVTFCLELALDSDRTPVFVYLDADVSIRANRLSKRDHEQELSQKRIISDEMNLPVVMGRIAQAVFKGRYGYFFIVNTGGFCEQRHIIMPVEGEPLSTSRTGESI